MLMVTTIWIQSILKLSACRSVGRSARGRNCPRGSRWLSMIWHFVFTAGDACCRCLLPVDNGWICTWILGWRPWDRRPLPLTRYTLLYIRWDDAVHSEASLQYIYIYIDLWSTQWRVSIFMSVRRSSVYRMAEEHSRIRHWHMDVCIMCMEIDWYSHNARCQPLRTTHTNGAFNVCICEVDEGYDVLGLLSRFISR